LPVGVFPVGVFAIVFTVFAAAFKSEGQGVNYIYQPQKGPSSNTPSALICA